MLRLSLVLVLFCFTCVYAIDDGIVQVFKDFNIVSDIIDEAPNEFLKVTFENGIVADKGNALTPTEAKNAPSLKWTHENYAFHTILMTTPDVPTLDNPYLSEALHWLIVNVPGDSIEGGELLCSYYGPMPFKGAGFMRYIIFVFEQLERIDFEKQLINEDDAKSHWNFNTREFSKKYNLGIPIAGNIFQTEYDETAAKLQEHFNMSVTDF